MAEKANNYPIPLAPPLYDAITGITYDSRGNMLTAQFRTGGETGTILASWTLTWHPTNNWLLKIVRS